jgi:hypothetical protein
MELVGRIREQVLKQKATFYTLKDYTPKDQHDLLTAVACDAALPAVLESEFLKGLGVDLDAAAEYIEKERYKTVLKVLAGVLTRAQIRVPGSVTKRFKVLRGLFKWPDSED